MQNRLRRVLFVALLRVVIRTANYCCYMSLRCNRLRLLAGLSFSAEQAKASVSMLLDARKKQPTTSLASPSRAHRRVLAEPTVPAPKARGCQCQRRRSPPPSGRPVTQGWSYA